MHKSTWTLSASVLVLSATLPAMAASAQPDDSSNHGGQHIESEMMDHTEMLLTQPWTGPFDGVPPWDQVSIEDFPAAFEAGMAQKRAEYEAIATNPETPNFENTNAALELAGDGLQRFAAIRGVHDSNLSSPQLRELLAEWNPKLSAFNDELTLDPRILARYKSVYDNRATLGLTAQQMRLVEQDYENLVRDGALLNAGDKTKLVAINSELSQLFNSFSSKVLADEETYITLENEADLAGLPDSFVASLKAAAKERNVEGWALVNTRSVMQPFLENSTRRDLRQKVYEAYVGRGDNGDANDTKATIAQILKLRTERAKLLGYETHAHYRMANTMAKDPERAMDLMMKVWPAAIARVAEEVADMQAVADAEGADITIAPYDYRFYAEKVRKAKYDLDQNEIKPYFQLNNMIDGMFDAAGRLYDLEFTENTGDVPVFHPDIRTFTVKDKRDGKDIGLFYMDNYARTGKRSGAWATTYRPQQALGGERQILGSNNNNFVKPPAGEVALVSVDDATTLFHEFGHALHYFLTDITYPGLRGTPRDFVEYPSQVNENWLLTRYILDNYATHYQTGEPMPQALVDKIAASRTFNEGFSTVEYLSSAIVDMKLHFRDTPVEDVAAFERDTLAAINMPAEIVMRHRLPQFNHLFSSDAYSAGYYSYLWSETMDADTWAAFEESGDVWNKELADRFRATLLSTGNETERAEAYRVFRGRDPDVNALLIRRGFPTGAKAEASANVSASVQANVLHSASDSASD